MVMVAIICRTMGFRVHDVPVIHMSRKGGQQSLKGVMKWLRVACECSGQLIKLRLALR
jgi:hypothetical protein